MNHILFSKLHSVTSDPTCRKIIELLDGQELTTRQIGMKLRLRNKGELHNPLAKLQDINALEKWKDGNNSKQTLRPQFRRLLQEIDELLQQHMLIK